MARHHCCRGSGSLLSEQCDHPCQESDDQREDASIEKRLGTHEVVQLEGHSQKDAHKAENHKG